MDATMAAGPKLQFGPPNEFGPQLDGEPDFPIFVFPPVLPAGQIRNVLAGSLFSKTYKWRSWVPVGGKWVLPWTLIASQPGVIHAVIDVASAKIFHEVVQGSREQLRLLFDWLNKTGEGVDPATLEWFLRNNSNMFPPGQDVRIVFEIPPMHLVDP